MILERLVRVLDPKMFSLCVRLRCCGTPTGIHGDGTSSWPGEFMGGNWQDGVKSSRGHPHGLGLQNALVFRDHKGLLQAMPLYQGSSGEHSYMHIFSVQVTARL